MSLGACSYTSVQNVIGGKLADKPWKAFERTVCKLFGGRRRGADYGGYPKGKNDCIAEGWSIECKLLKKPTYGLIFAACEQAEVARESPQDIPVAVVKKKGARVMDSLVCFRMETFLEFFVGESEG